MRVGDTFISSFMSRDKGVINKEVVTEWYRSW